MGWQSLLCGKMNLNVMNKKKFTSIQEYKNYGTNHDLLTYLLNDKAVHRTSPATPRLLITVKPIANRVGKDRVFLGLAVLPALGKPRLSLLLYSD